MVNLTALGCHPACVDLSQGQRKDLVVVGPRVFAVEFCALVGKIAVSSCQDKGRLAGLGLSKLLQEVWVKDLFGHQVRWIDQSGLDAGVSFRKQVDFLGIGVV